MTCFYCGSSFQRYPGLLPPAQYFSYYLPPGKSFDDIDRHLDEIDKRLDEIEKLLAKIVEK